MLWILIWVLLMSFDKSNETYDHDKEQKYAPKAALLQPRGFCVTIEEAQDIRQMHIFWNYRKPYNRTNPYSTTDFTNVSFNENFLPTLTVEDRDIQLRIGDSIFYWLLLVTRDWERITLHKLNFWVNFDKQVSHTVAEHFAETYYREYETDLHDEM